MPTLESIQLAFDSLGTTREAFAALGIVLFIYFPMLAIGRLLKRKA